VPSGGLVFSVDRGSETLHTIGLSNGQRSDFTVTTTVGRGDTVYFVVDAVADANCDLTSLQLTITFE
jgi:phage terminase large subunit-like protein